MSMRLYHFDYEYDKQTLLEEAKQLEGYKPFVDPHPQSDLVFNDWQIKHVRLEEDSFPYAIKVATYFQDLLDVIIEPRFYYQKPNFTLPFHQDRGTLCSINLVLTENLEPITFEDGTEYYRIALLNTQARHSITTKETERRLYKLSIKEYDFQEVKKRLELKCTTFM